MASKCTKAAFGAIRGIEPENYSKVKLDCYIRRSYFPWDREKTAELVFISLIIFVT